MTAFLAREGRASGGHQSETIRRYLLSMPYFVLVFPVLIALTVGEAFFASGYRYLVAFWVEGCARDACGPGKLSAEVSLRTTLSSASRETVLLIFTAFVAAGVCVHVLAQVARFAAFANGGRLLHDDMVRSFGRVRVTFFDEHPSGRLIRRFSGDYGQLKHDVPQYLSDVASCVVELLWIGTLVVLSAPAAGVACVPCGFFYYRVQRLFRPAARELQRLTKVLETPVWSLFTETAGAAFVIRAYGRGEEFETRLKEHLTAYGLGVLTQSRMMRWLTIRLKFISELFGLCVTMVVVVSAANGALGAGTAGFLMSLTIGLDLTMQWLTRSVTLLDTGLVGVERVLEYRNLPAETDGLPQGNKGSMGSSADGTGDPGAGNRPALTGLLTFEHFSASYRDDLPLVLKDVSFVVPAGAKVGIIGRTGAGKSTLFQALFRMLARAQGDITLGGESLFALPLEHARSLFGIVPQEPHLFSGTLRMNLDRMRQFDERDLWRALSQVGLGVFVESQGAGLDFKLAERGANLSVGQRQLICMARALLTDARVILMDEATASVDLETDRMLTRAVDTALAGRTKLVIAHRLATVRDADAVLVLHDGRVQAFGPPDEILRGFLGLPADGEGEPQRQGTDPLGNCAASSVQDVRPELDALLG